MNSNLRILFSIVFCLLISSSVFGQFWQLDLGVELSEGVSDNGVVSGPGYYWNESDGVVDIGGLPAGNGVGNQYKISNDGTRISGSITNTQTGLADAAFFDIPSGQWNLVGGFGDSCDAESSGAWSISGDGQFVVGLGWQPGCQARAFIGDLNGVVDLGTTAAGNPTRANGVDEDGNVVCGWQDGNGRQGAVWVDGVQELINLPSGDPAQESSAVSNDGRWVTGFGIGPFNGPPATTYRYDTITNTTIDIPNLSVGGLRLFAGTGISDDGKTIVGGTWGNGPAFLGTAVIWREGVGTTLFSEFLDNEGVDYPDGFNFAFVSDVSSDGSWFTGWSLDDSFNRTTWVVKLPQSVETVTPTAFEVFRGIVINAELGDFLESDDTRASFNPGFILNNTEAPVWLIFDANASNATEIFVESQAGTPGISISIQAFDWMRNTFIDIDTMDETFNVDTVVSVALDPALHIDSNGDVRCRIGWVQTGFTLNFPWEIRVDQVGWNQ